jgi:hypothetical protein
VIVAWHEVPGRYATPTRKESGVTGVQELQESESIQRYLNGIADRCEQNMC